MTAIRAAISKELLPDDVMILALSITAVLVYIKDNSCMALKFLEMGRDVPLSFDAFLDLIGIFPQREIPWCRRTRFRCSE